MSRSRKKTPIVKDYSTSNKFYLRQANKKVRHYKGTISDGNEYKRLYCSWNICDHSCYISKTLLEESDPWMAKYLKSCLRK